MSSVQAPGKSAAPDVHDVEQVQRLTENAKVSLEEIRKRSEESDSARRKRCIGK